MACVYRCYSSGCMLPRLEQKLPIVQLRCLMQICEAGNTTGHLLGAVFHVFNQEQAPCLG